MSEQYPCGVIVEVADGRSLHFSNVESASLCKQSGKSFVLIEHPEKQVTVVRNAVSLSVATPQDMLPWCAP